MKMNGILKFYTKFIHEDNYTHILHINVYDFKYDYTKLSFPIDKNVTRNSSHYILFFLRVHP